MMDRWFSPCLSEEADEDLQRPGLHLSKGHYSRTLIFLATFYWVEIKHVGVRSFFLCFRIQQVLNVCCLFLC